MRAFQKTLFFICFGAVGLGIILIIFGASFGGYRNYGGWPFDRTRSVYQQDWTDVVRAEEAVTDIEMDIDYAKVSICYGDAFRITGEGLDESLLHSENINGIWKITYRDSESNGWFYDFFSRRSFDSEITLTIPRGTKLDRFALKMGAGIAEAEDITSSETVINVGAGEMKAGSLTSDGSVTFSVGAGKITADNVNAGRIDLKCGAGSIRVSGTVRDGGTADCGVGEIIMNLEGDPEEYGYLVECKLGKVELNGESYSFSKLLRRDGQKEKQFDVNCGVGRVSLNIENKK